MKKIILLLLVSFSSLSFACSFSTDCSVGSQCVKSSGSLYGYCVGGMFPGNDYDRVPAYNPFDLSGKQGNTCSFDLDCGVRGNCVKSGGNLNGTCM
jgi:hypothetical protein